MYHPVGVVAHSHSLSKQDMAHSSSVVDATAPHDPKFWTPELIVRSAAVESSVPNRVEKVAMLCSEDAHVKKVRALLQGAIYLSAWCSSIAISK